jgi:hypothetical protein
MRSITEMARKIGSIMAAGEKYQSREGEKTRWIRCGVLLETDKGYRIKMDAMPVVSDGWFAVFEEEETTRGANPPPRQEPARRDPAPAYDDKFGDEDLPF